jgi:hypothetical protein
MRDKEFEVEAVLNGTLVADHHALAGKPLCADNASVPP